MRAHLREDGTLHGIGEIAGAVELDEIAPHKPGDRLVLDPQNPRRAIVAPPAPRKAADARLEEAIALKLRSMALANLTVADEYPGAAEEQTKVDAKVTAIRDAADLADDWPDEVPKG